MPCRVASSSVVMGAPLPGVEVKTVRDDGTDAAAEEVGELWIRSDVMFPGYLNKQEQTDAAMHDGWYRSGDLGYRDAEGNVYIVDRVKDMIISGGENVYSAEVEQALYQHADIAECAVVAPCESGAQPDQLGIHGRAVRGEDVA